MSALEGRDPDTGRLKPWQLRPVVPFVCDAVWKAGPAVSGGWRCPGRAPCITQTV